MTKPVIAVKDKLRQIRHGMPAPLTQNDAQFLLDYIIDLERVTDGVVQNYRNGKPSQMKLMDMATGALLKVAANDNRVEIRYDGTH